VRRIGGSRSRSFAGVEAVVHPIRVVADSPSSSLSQYLPPLLLFHLPAVKCDARWIQSFSPRCCHDGGRRNIVSAPLLRLPATDSETRYGPGAVGLLGESKQESFVSKEPSSLQDDEPTTCSGNNDEDNLSFHPDGARRRKTTKQHCPTEGATRRLQARANRGADST
jgi:hypothetical protein